jgi:hypothetical protein
MAAANSAHARCVSSVFQLQGARAAKFAAHQDPILNLLKRVLPYTGLILEIGSKLAANYLAFVQLASIRLWLRVNESTS